MISAAAAAVAAVTSVAAGVAFLVAAGGHALAAFLAASCAPAGDAPAPSLAAAASFALPPLAVFSVARMTLQAGLGGFPACSRTLDLNRDKYRNHHSFSGE